MALSDTAPTASIFLDFQPRYVMGARRGLAARMNVNKLTGPAKETDSFMSTGAVVTSVEKRTLTGRTDPFPIKNSESEPRNCFLLA